MSKDIIKNEGSVATQTLQGERGFVIDDDAMGLFFGNQTLVFSAKDDSLKFATKYGFDRTKIFSYEISELSNPLKITLEQAENMVWEKTQSQFMSR